MRTSHCVSARPGQKTATCGLLGPAFATVSGSDGTSLVSVNNHVGHMGHVHRLSKTGCGLTR